MYKPLQKKDASWNPPSSQKKGKGKPGTFEILTFKQNNSSEQQDVPKAPAVGAPGIIENVMRNMARQQQEHEAALGERQSEAGFAPVTDVGMEMQQSPVIEASPPEVQSTEMGIQRECAECATGEQQESAAEGKDVSEISAQAPGIQRKLTVGAPGDPYEQEADRVAAQVMSMSVAPESSPQVQRQVEPVVQRAGGGDEASGDLESRLNASQGGGNALAPEVRAFMEPRFGADFSGVRVHTGAEAVQMNRELGAQAFAHGSDVYFGEGKEPGNNELMAHEITPLVQQTGAVQRQNQKQENPIISSLARTQSLTGLETEKVVGDTNQSEKQTYGGAGPSPTGETNPQAIIGLDKFIELVNNVEESYPDDTRSQIVTRIRNLYYRSSSIPFERLLPHADNYESDANILRVVRRGRVGKETYNRLIAQANENKKGDNPSPYILLPNKQLVDIGHLLLSLDALLHPGSESPYTNYQVPTIDPASWVADIGIASVWMTKRPHPDNISSTRNSSDPDDHYKASASEADLLGDIDSFGVHRHLNLFSDSSLSSLIKSYYYGGPAEGVGRRFLTFCLSNGFVTIKGNRVKWRSREELNSELVPRINRFCDLYGSGVLGAGITVVTGHLNHENWPYTPYMLGKFLDWVEANLQVELGG